MGKEKGEEEGEKNGRGGERKKTEQDRENGVYNISPFTTLRLYLCHVLAK